MLVVLLAVMVVQLVLVVVLCVAGVASQAVAVPVLPSMEVPTSGQYQSTPSTQHQLPIPRGHSSECHVYARKLHFLFFY